MSSLKSSFRPWALLLLVLPFVAACTFMPVYGTNNVGDTLLFNYAEPKTRFEQIVYQHLGSTLGRGTKTTAPHASITLSMSARRVGRTSAGSVFTTYQMVATGTITVVDSKDNTKILLSNRRTAAANYELSGQILADRAAKDEAEERAARAFAEAVRLTLLSAFSTKR